MKLEGVYIIDPGGPWHNKYVTLYLQEDRFTIRESEPFPTEKTIYLTPGWVDLEVYTQAPLPHPESDPFTLAQAARKGGFTRLFLHSTNPSWSDPQTLYTIKQNLPTPVYWHMVGHALDAEGHIAPLQTLLEAGSYGWRLPTLPSGPTLRALMQYSAALHKTLWAVPFPPDWEPTGIPESLTTTLLGWQGIPKFVEAQTVHQLGLFAQTYGATLHLLSLSTYLGVQATQNYPLTVSTSVPYLVWDSANLIDFDPIYKCHPPVRGDVKALQKAIVPQLLSIASQHMPRSFDEKKHPWSKAAFGQATLEISFPVLYQTLVEGNLLTLNQLIFHLTHLPRQQMGLPLVHIAENEPLEWTFFIQTPWTLSEKDFAYPYGNATHIGQTFPVKVIGTLIQNDTDGRDQIFEQVQTLLTH